MGCFVLALGEDVDSRDHGLGTAVLANLGSAKVDNLARMSLEHDEISLLQTTGRDLFSATSTGLTGLEILFCCFNHLI